MLPPGAGFSVCLWSLIVGAGRFDGCHHRGRPPLRVATELNLTSDEVIPPWLMGHAAAFHMLALARCTNEPWPRPRHWPPTPLRRVRIPPPW
jgi:hypothetical protein